MCFRSISLLIQVSLPCALLGSAPVKLTLGGGTNAEAAPQIDFLIQVFQPMARRLGIDFKLDVKMRCVHMKTHTHTHPLHPQTCTTAFSICSRTRALQSERTVYCTAS